MMFMLNQDVTPPIYTPQAIVESIGGVNSGATTSMYNNLTMFETVGSINNGGTFLNPLDSFSYYIIKKQTEKEFILSLFDNEISFDEEDEIAAEKEMKRLSVKKKRNFFDYYD